MITTCPCNLWKQQKLISNRILIWLKWIFGAGFGPHCFHLGGVFVFSYSTNVTFQQLYTILRTQIQQWSLQIFIVNLFSSHFWTISCNDFQPFWCIQDESANAMLFRRFWLRSYFAAVLLWNTFFFHTYSISTYQPKISIKDWPPICSLVHERQLGNHGLVKKAPPSATAEFFLFSPLTFSVFLCSGAGWVGNPNDRLL